MLECVPNFSEGEDSELIGQIVSAVKSAKVLNLHSDPDHNRSVVTMAGEEEEIVQGAFELTERAMQLLDVRGHTGAHPFIGVMDVIPFIPLSGSTMKEAVDAAHSLGKMLWQELKLPVYYYGEAAKIPERKELPYVRKGGYEALKREINEKHRRPDEGQGLHVTAGAAAVGARDFLIAFNVNLKTNDLDIARSIAKNIREKDGGLKGVRALGLELKSRNLTQVSINVTDHQETSLKSVFDQIKRWTREYQTEIAESELVGLIPKAATWETIKRDLKLNNYTQKCIIENNL